jgi:hypothetical protein
MPVVFTKSVNAGSEAGNAESNRRRRPSRDVGAARRSTRACRDGGTERTESRIPPRLTTSKPDQRIRVMATSQGSEVVPGMLRCLRRRGLELF